MYKNVLHLLLAVSFLNSSTSWASSIQKLTKRANKAADALISVVQIPDKTIPKSLLERATCIASIPNVVRVGFIFGARHGDGLVSCRVNGGWSNPSFLSVSGGSWGLQIGMDSTDLVLVFMNSSAPDRLSSSNFTLGGEASVAAGPLGRNAQFGTDYKLKSEIVAYSKSKGLFAGLTLSGNLLKVDHDANDMVYGSSISTSHLLATKAANNQVTDSFMSALMNYAY